MDDEEKKNLLPARIKPGATIGIVAPASPFDVNIFKRGVQTLTAMGFRIHIPTDLFECDGYLAGSDEHRADAIHRLFADQAIDAIVCARGGFGSLRILARLDFDLIQKNPKIFIGYSDISALLWAIYARSGLVTFHGPLITTLAQAPAATRQALQAAISSGEQLTVKPRKAVCIHPGAARGRVCGGNLTTLCHLLGTPFEPNFRDQIVMFEDRGEAPYRIDRMLSQMKLAGCFENLAGLMLGDFVDCGPDAEILRIVKNVFYSCDIPILAGFEFGHGRQNITVPIGLEATLDADAQLLSFHQAATRHPKQNALTR